MFINNTDKKCTPWIEDYTKEDDEKITRIWKKYGGTYIEDPLSCDQCLYIMLKEIPYLVKKMNFGKIFVANDAYDMFEYYYTKEG